jgi:hypothetical protein
VQEGDWNGILLLREERREVDVEYGAVVIFNLSFEVRKRINVVFPLAPGINKSVPSQTLETPPGLNVSPIIRCLPVGFGVGHPLMTNPK